MNQEQPPTEPTIDNEFGRESHPDILPTPDFFPVSILKLIVMSVCTSGIYNFYWYYKNWQLIKERENLDIMPIWRGVFAFFFCYSLFKKVRATANSLGLTRSIAAGPLALGWIVVTILWQLPNLYSLVAYFAVLFLIPVQILVNDINAESSPGHDENKRFTAWNITAVVFGGGAVFLLAVLILLAVFGFVPIEIEEMIFKHAE